MLPPRRPPLRGWLRRHRLKLLGLLLGLCVTGLGIAGCGRSRFPKQSDAGLPPQPQPPQDLGATPVHPRPLQRVWTPSITTAPQPRPSGIWRGSVALLGGLCSEVRCSWACVAVAICHLHCPRRRDPARVRSCRKRPQSGGLKLRLLDVRSQEAMVWGIGRFVAEERTRQLDVPATVEATAANAGMPRLCFVRARHQREVWLWVDESTARGPQPQATVLPQLHKELVVSLRQGGLPVEEALYWGLPDRLSRLHESGQVESEFAPAKWRSGKTQRWWCCSRMGGCLPMRSIANGIARKRRRCCGSLPTFPQLAFCDVSRGEYGLASRLAKLEIPVLWPEQVAKFLGGSRRASRCGRPSSSVATSGCGRQRACCGRTRWTTRLCTGSTTGWDFRFPGSSLAKVKKARAAMRRAAGVYRQSRETGAARLAASDLGCG